MSHDPYAISEAYLVELPAEAVGVVSGLRADLRRVGFFQRWIMVSLTTLIVAFFAAILAASSYEPGSRGLSMLLMAFAVLSCLSAAPPTYMIASGVYEDRRVAVVLALLTCVPLVNLFVVIGVNTKAIGVLDANGIAVGFFGAELSEI